MFLLFFMLLFFAGCVKIPTKFTFKKVAAGLSFPEGPAWDGKSTLYMSNCYGDWISRLSEGLVDTFALKPTKPDSFGQTNGMTVFKDGFIYACDFGLGAIVRFMPCGCCNIVVAGYEGQRFNRINDLAFDSKGHLYFTDPKSYGADKPDGRLFVYSTTDSSLKLLFEGLCFPNGIAFSADGKHLFVAESARARVLKFKVNEDGALGDSMVFAHLPGGDPDGLALDVEGNLYAAHFGGSAIQVFSPNGVLKYKISTPGQKPSNLEFGGEDMCDLYITEDETNAVYITRTIIPGLKLFSSPGK